MSISRRQFLKSSLVVAGGASLLPITTFAQPADIAKSQEGVDLSLLQTAWDESGMPPPLVYLQKVGLLSLSENIQEASKRDFLAGRMLSVNGLMLSHAESAFLLSASGGFHV